MNYQFLKSLFYCNAVGFLFWTLWTMIGLLSRKNARYNNGPAAVLSLLLILYFSSVIAITLVPLPFSTYRHASNTDLNFIPVLRSVKVFLYPFKYNRMALLPDILENLIGNVLMFIPFGLLVPMAKPWFRSWYRVLLMPVLFSCGIEASQWIWRYFGNYRHVDIDDVILNSFGAFVGYGFFLLLKKLKELFTRPKQEMIPVTV